MKLSRSVSDAGVWVRRHRKILIGSLIALALLSIAIQLVYPYGRALPLASVAGQSVGFHERPSITLAIQNRFTEATVTLKSGTVEQTSELASLGARVNADDMASQAVDYPLLFRFMPFSLVWYQPQLNRYQLEFDDSRLDVMVEELADKLSYKPVDAGLELETGELEVIEAKSGQTVTAKKLRESIVSTSYNWDNTVVDVANQTEEPTVSNASIADIREQALKVLSQDITIMVADRGEFSPDRPTIVSWLSIEQADDGSVRLSDDEAALAAYAKKIAQQTTTKPSETVVKTVDDRETERDEGSSGLGIVASDLTSQLRQIIEQPRDTPISVQLARKPIKPPVRYIRSYTSSQAGLRAYAEDTADSGDIYLSVRQLDNDRWSADGDADESIPSASTYKPLLMLRVFEDINSGKLRWSTKIDGESVQQCFDRMIVLSANECAEALIERYGVQELTDYLHSRGFSDGTGFTFSETTQTTAADLAKLMVGIENSELLSKGNRGMMLEKMGRQIFRQGVPAGTSANTYNKVGFLWDYLHDAAIVKHPKGDYVVAVMTKGESWQKIAQITRDIEAILYGDGLAPR